MTGLTSLDVAISVNSNNAGKVYRSSWLVISILCRIQLNGGKGKTLHFPHFSLKRVPLFNQTHLTVSGSNHRLVVSGSAIGGGGGGEISEMNPGGSLNHLQRSFNVVSNSLAVLNDE